MNATLTSKGQITIPQAIRDELGLKPGQKLDFRLSADRKIEVEVVDDVTLDTLMNVLPKASKRVSVEAMKQAIRERAGHGRT